MAEYSMLKSTLINGIGIKGNYPGYRERKREEKHEREVKIPRLQNEKNEIIIECGIETIFEKIMPLIVSRIVTLTSGLESQILSHNSK